MIARAARITSMTTRVKRGYPPRRFGG